MPLPCIPKVYTDCILHLARMRDGECHQTWSKESTMQPSPYNSKLAQVHPTAKIGMGA